MAAEKETRLHTARGMGRFSRLWRTRSITRASMVVERLWPLALPAVIVAALFLTVAWFGLFALVPTWLRIASIVVFGLGLAAAAWPLTRYRAPGPAEIDRRIERANALQHAPVTTITDRLSGNERDAFANALWQEHRRRMAESLGRLEGDMPRARVPERDPWGARALVALLLVTAFAYSFGPRGGSIADAFRTPPGAEPVPARIDAWVTPPPYTGRAPVFLTAEGNSERDIFRVPEGSEFAVRITGGARESLAYEDEAGVAEIAPEGGFIPDDAPVPASRQFSGKLARDGILSLQSGEQPLRSWTFEVIPDTAPQIRFAGDPKRAVNGALELQYEIEDDYGATEATTGFVLAERPLPGARALYQAPEMPLALPRRGSSDIAAKTSRDLTEHPWAGTQVDLTLTVRDAAGQQGRSEPKRFLLPERAFSNPLARALIEQRRLLALDANRQRRVLDLMDAVTLRPEDTFDNPSHYLGIMTARTRLMMAEEDDELRGVVDYLWEVALGIEEGDLTAAERRLRQAQEALRQALENGASEQEIEELMAELREAMQEFMREFAERSMQNPNSAMQQMPENGSEMRQSDLERMLDQLEDLAKSGARDQAEQLLSQLEQMMNNLRMGQQQADQGQSGQNQMREQMDQLGEMMRRQQELMNETFQLDQMQRGRNQGQQRQGQQGQQQNGQGQPMTPEEFAEALRQLQQGQGQLQQQLESLMEGLEGMGIQPGEGFGEAGEAMGQAEGALGEGEGNRAVGEQGRALEALRRGAQDMMQQMQQAMQGEEGGSEEGGRQQSSDNDPLGRPRATTGPDFGDSVKVPDEIDSQRAREILEAIRRRLGNALSPELERNYLERLLDLDTR
ncbi:TIGR02302 family protein [Mesorhizobium sp. Z1-4]|uniref:TIGR02302 family protein n=1 Tax=Mesorhizobium sp. Z1-4 TaxID=2448478 RepID=UPI001FE13B6A|nr:TIGR02302 family protein [Mesorhizobium sp. Z1-4]